MPLITVTLKQSELIGLTRIKLERPYQFSKISLAHVYHNIDSVNFSKSTADPTQQCLLYVKLGGLVDNSKQIINYHGSYTTGSFHRMRPNSEDKDDYQTGNESNVGAAQNAKKLTTPASNYGFQADVNVDHMIPIGASRMSTKELISRDLFKKLHDGGVLYFDGELKFQLFYQNALGVIEPITSDTGGIITSTSAKKHVTYLTLVFDYEEIIQ